MRRILFVALATTSALLGATGAQAKAPPDGVDVCGASETCVHLTVQQAETNWALWSPPDPYNSVRPSAIAPFLLVRWHWPEQAAQSAYYVPSSGKVRQVDERGSLAWYSLTDAKAVRTLTANVDTFPVPNVTHVTIGGRVARDPQSYLRVFSVGQETFPAILPGWLRVRLTGDTPSPWTDTASDVRISRRGRLLWLDGTILRIPLPLAQRIRAGRSLRF
jgi:hypothetical protein